ncbi:MAG TPA: GNAT family N-acetyltransferase [Vicinamibacterales bacterium]|nr:GNAT family N-acetyltransferase [Vicinamibacterales bacterium]
MTGTVILETERLTLRELEPNDLDFLASMMADPDVSHHYDRRFSREASEQWLNRQLERYATDGHGMWLAMDKATGAPVGQVGLVIQTVENRRRPEIGWLLDRPQWGKGYATEAGAAVRDAAFSRWKYPEVISLIRPANLPSQRVAERIGLKPGPRVWFNGSEHIVFQQSAGK